jgi:hypothetical protein
MAFPSGFGAVGAQSFNRAEPRLLSAYLQQWNLTAERELLRMGLRLSYIGTASRQIVWYHDLNLPPPSLIPFNDNRRPWPAIRAVSNRENGGNSMYHSLHVVAERKYRDGLYYQLGWTWAKNLTDVHLEGENGGQPQNMLDRRAERGNASYMPRHRVVGQLLFPLPLGRGRKLFGGLRSVPNMLVGGWMISAALTAQTGTWFHPTYAGYDVANTNIVSGRPDRIASGALPPGERTIYRWFDASAFRVPGDSSGDGRPDVAVGRYGNCGTNILDGPGQFVLNLGVNKEISLAERARAVLQLIAANATNHVNYNLPAANISAPATVGRITSAGAARVLTVSLRIEF